MCFYESDAKVPISPSEREGTNITRKFTLFLEPLLLRKSNDPLISFEALMPSIDRLPLWESRLLVRGDRLESNFLSFGS